MTHAHLRLTGSFTRASGARPPKFRRHIRFIFTCFHSLILLPQRRVSRSQRHAARATRIDTGTASNNTTRVKHRLTATTQFTTWPAETTPLPAARTLTHTPPASPRSRNPRLHHPGTATWLRDWHGRGGYLAPLTPQQQTATQSSGEPHSHVASCAVAARAQVTSERCAFPGAGPRHGSTACTASVHAAPHSTLRIWGAHSHVNRTRAQSRSQRGAVAAALATVRGSTQPRRRAWRQRVVAAWTGSASPFNA